MYTYLHLIFILHILAFENFIFYIFLKQNYISFAPPTHSLRYMSAKNASFGRLQINQSINQSINLYA